jgi:hypothetical protein
MIYEQPFKNPADRYIVKPVENGFGIFVRHDRNKNGSCDPDTRIVDQLFEDADDAHEWIEGRREFFEQDYDDYLDENRFEIVRMEQYAAAMGEG